MLPKGKLGRSQFRKLKVHAGAGPDHQYKAQKAEVLILS
jgi:ribosomal protein L13